MLKSWKAKIHFWFEDIQTPPGRAVDIVDIIVVALVFVVSLIFIIKTFPISEHAMHSLDIAENVIVGIFVVEYFCECGLRPQR
ncbi:MAG: hypothetical protein KAJ34_00035 [Thermodesulfovibrionia bacterium]|nr:hypothetical protein [Thermodesulfovibrionia bacterium]